MHVILIENRKVNANILQFSHWLCHTKASNVMQLHLKAECKHFLLSPSIAGCLLCVNNMVFIKQVLEGLHTHITSKVKYPRQSIRLYRVATLKNEQIIVVVF